MWITYILFCLFGSSSVLFFSSAIYATKDENLAYSNLPFRYELELLASSFQENLRQELAKLEMEMYDEFLKLVQEIDTEKRNLTEALTSELSVKVDEVMGKFKKVMIYSTGRVEVLNDEMKSLMERLTNWVERGHDPVPKNDPPRKRQRRKRNRWSKSDRSKRHTGNFIVHKDDIILKDIPAAKQLLELEPENFPVVEDIENIDALLEGLGYFDGELENHDSDFILKEFSSDSKNRFILETMPKKERLNANLETVEPKDILPRNCYDFLKAGNTQSGVYLIYPSGKGEGVKAWCDQDTEGGGWTVIVNRQSTFQQRNVTETVRQYNYGFGEPTSEHWIGLDIMHQLTRGISHVLRVHLEDSSGNKTYATYDTFRIGESDSNYTIEVNGYNLNSTADDALSIHSGMPFVYPIAASDKGCSGSLGVGWWYLEYPLCFQALATGRFKDADAETDAVGVEWTSWKGNIVNIQALSFMIRPHTK